MFEQWGLTGLFVSAAISASLFPGGSEVILLWLANQQLYSESTLLLVATTGNTLGGMSSWVVGYWLRRRLRLPAWLDKTRYQQAMGRIRQRGAVVLLLSWLPLIGDPLCLVAGWLRIGWLPALIFIALGKAARYAVLLLMV